MSEINAWTLVLAAPRGGTSEYVVYGTTHDIFGALAGHGTRYGDDPDDFVRIRTVWVRSSAVLAVKEGA